MSTTLSTLSLNCWGIPVVSKNLTVRIHAIAKALAETHYDFVCLQEVWTEKDYMLIKKQAGAALPYAHYFYSGVLGSGLCILSKYCIESAIFHRWTLNGYAHKIQHGDWFAGKGIGLCTFSVNGVRVNVYNTHMHAEYCCEGRNKYYSHRICQSFDSAQFVYVTSAYADVIILAGDFNTEPGDLCYKILQQHAALMDSFCVAAEIHNDGGMGTNDCLRNSYSCPKMVKNHPQGKRIDHILFRASPGVEVRVASYSLPLPMRIAGRDFSYSDHEAVSVTLTVAVPGPGESEKKPCPIPRRKKEELATLDEARSVVYNSLFVLDGDRKAYAFCSLFVFMLLMTSMVMENKDDVSSMFVGIIVRGLITVLLIFTIFMGTVWNALERNALLASHEAMTVALSYRPAVDAGGK